MCAVMLRGRHRGLPLAIDRSIMLPSELKNLREADENVKIE
jgi:Trk-type K+ transport system membrane component